MAATRSWASGPKLWHRTRFRIRHFVKKHKRAQAKGSGQEIAADQALRFRHQEPDKANPDLFWSAYKALQKGGSNCGALPTW
jgi:hypothetical protein